MRKIKEGEVRLNVCVCVCVRPFNVLGERFKG